MSESKEQKGGNYIMRKHIICIHQRLPR